MRWLKSFPPTVALLIEAFSRFVVSFNARWNEAVASPQWLLP